MKRAKHRRTASDAAAPEPTRGAASEQRLGVPLRPTASFGSVLWRDTARGESWPAYVERYGDWKRANGRYRMAHGVWRYQQLALLTGALLGALLMVPALDTAPGPAPDGGVGQALDLPYLPAYRQQFPDCRPLPPPDPRPDPRPDPQRVVPQDAARAREEVSPVTAAVLAARSLLVLDVEGQPRRMGGEEFAERKRAADRSLAQVWVVGVCTARPPGFESGSIAPLRLTEDTSQPAQPRQTTVPPSR